MKKSLQIAKTIIKIKTLVEFPEEFKSMFNQLIQENTIDLKILEMINKL